MANRLKFVRRRNWTDIRELWAGYLPDEYEPGSPLNDDVLVSPAIVVAVESCNDDVSTTSDLDFMKPLCMRQGLFLAHKANHFMSRALEAATGGRPTTGATLAYQSALYSARAITRWLGVTIWRHPDGGRRYIIDLWPSLDDRKTADNVALVHRWNNFEARNTWQLFVRLIEVTANIELDRLLRLVMIRNKDKVSGQRNRLHYEDHFWIYDDLLAEPSALSEDELIRARLRDDISIRSNLNFSLQLGVLLSSCVDKMFREIASDYPIVDNEFQLFIAARTFQPESFDYKTPSVA